MRIKLNNLEWVLTAWLFFVVYAGQATAEPKPQFVLIRDGLSFTNGLLWEYSTNAAGAQIHRRRVPRPEFHSRCFAMARMALLFHGHAAFDSSQPPLPPHDTLRRIRKVLKRPTRSRSAPEEKVTIPGYSGLHELSSALRPAMMNSCGGAWRSYVQCSHWRMVFPFSKRNQRDTATRLTRQLQRGEPALLHIVRFPDLTINHAVLAFDAVTHSNGLKSVVAYDPNQPLNPLTLRWNESESRFSMEPNEYFAGGRVDVHAIGLQRN